MKKAWIILALLFTPVLVYGSQDRWGSEREDVARTSFTCSQDGVVIVTNTAVILYAVNVTSPSPNAWSYILNNGTTQQVKSTYSVVSNSYYGPSGTKPRYLFTGFSYNKIGSACVEFLFDYLRGSGDFKYQ